MAWILSNLGTIVVGLVVLVIVYFAFQSVRKDFNSGSCSGVQRLRRELQLLS